MKKYILSISLILITLFGVSSVYAISATGWTVTGQNTYFDGSGNVGIGTTSPGSKLDLSGMLNIKSNNDQSSQLVLQPMNGTGQKYGFGTSNGSELYIGRTSGTGGGIYPDLSVIPNGNTSYLGINTYTPATDLDVKGSIRTISPGDNASQFVLMPANGTSGQSYGMATKVSGGLYFGRSAGPSQGLNEDIFISSSGYIGINNKYPSERLDVNGDIKFSGSVTHNIKSGGNDICIGNC